MVLLLALGCFMTVTPGRTANMMQIKEPVEDKARTEEGRVKGETNLSSWHN